MTAVLKGVGAVVRHDGVLYEFFKGEIPDGTPAEVIETLRQRGALASHAPDSPDEPGPAAPHNPGGPGSPDDAPDPLEVDTATLARFIDVRNLNAPATVALARSDPARAQAVIDAELVANGGDGRATVVRPLTKLVDDATAPE